MRKGHLIAGIDRHLRWPKILVDFVFLAFYFTGTRFGRR
jgi:hypothetical protein